MSDSATENPIQKASRTAALGGGDEEEGDQGIDQNETSFFAPCCPGFRKRKVIIHACMEFYDAGHVE